MTTRLASHARRRDVSAGTCVPSSRTDWPGEPQRVGVLLRHRGRFLGDVSGPGAWVRGARPLMKRLAGRSQRLQKHGADLRVQPPTDDDPTVSVLIHMQRAASVAPRRLARFGLSIDPAPAADDALDVLGRAGRPNPELPTREGLGQQRPSRRGPARRGPAHGRRPGPAPPATSAMRRTRQSPCSSRLGRRTPGSDRAGGRRRHRGGRRARRSGRRDAPGRPPSRQWVE